MRFPALVLVLAAVACSKGGGGAPADEVIQGWKAAGLETSPFVSADGSALGGGRCKSGTVGGLDATLCEYADENAAKAAVPAGYQKVGDAKTGVALADGKVLLVLADRKNADPSGKRFNDIARSFRKSK